MIGKFIKGNGSMSVSVEPCLVRFISPRHALLLVRALYARFTRSQCVMGVMRYIKPSMSSTTRHSYQGLLAMLCVSQVSYAHLVSPELYAWYKAATSDHMDSCINFHYRYEHLNRGSPRDIASQLLILPASPTNCNWHAMEQDFSASKVLPPDFPSSHEEWNALSGDANRVTQTWKRACVNQDGFIDSSISVPLYPSYRCPAGSFQSLDTESYTFGCSTHPIGWCLADIVGRDLDSAGMSRLGHIGLTVYSNVIEVLQAAKVVQVNSLDHFKTQSPFWGRRYGTALNPDLTWEEAQNIILEAKKQSVCSPAYTLSWTFSTCDSGKPAKFRCDSFVYNAYLVGAHIDLSYTPLITYPRTLFNGMLNCRDSFIASCAEADLVTLFILKPARLSHLALQGVLSQESIDWHELDQLSKKTVLSSAIDRRQKVALFWSLQNKFHEHAMKHGYWLDVLSELEPIEKTAALIRAVHQEKNSARACSYLMVLISAMTPENVSQHPQEAMQAKDFLRETLRDSHDEAMVGALIINYPETFIDKRTYYLMRKRLGTLSARTVQAIVANSSFWYQWLALEAHEPGGAPAWSEQLFDAANDFAHEDCIAHPIADASDICRAFKLGLASRMKKTHLFKRPDALKNESVESLSLQGVAPFLQQLNAQKNRMLKARKDAQRPPAIAGSNP